jgi:uncharacterized protein (TIGR02284 family)
MMPTEQSSIDQLNPLLRSELSAVETYDSVLDGFPNSSDRRILRECANSHRARVRTLREMIGELGGVPADTSGVWGGAAARLVRHSASAVGEGAAIAALEEGEDHGGDDYYRALDQLDAATRKLVEARLVPEQRRTRDAVRALRRGLAA